MTPPKIIVDMSNTITNIAEKILIFYPTPKNTRLLINILYLVTLFTAFAAIISYDYVAPTSPIQIKHNTTITTQTLPLLFNLTNVTTNDNEPTVIQPPQPLVQNKYIRLGIGIIGAYLAIAFLYSNTQHSKLKDWDNTHS